MADVVEKHGYSKEGCEILALAYIMLAESYAWAAKFKIAVQYLNKARQLAQKVDSQELLNRINNDQREFRDLFKYDRSNNSSDPQSNSSDGEESGCFSLLFCVGGGLVIAGPLGALAGFGLWYFINKK